MNENGVTRPCHYCGEPLDPDNAYSLQRVQGWERKAVLSGRRGGSDIVFRQPLQEWAHADCVRRERDGVNVAQGSFLA